MKANEILKTAVKELDERKAFDIKAIKIDGITELADYFVIATATSSTHVRALSDYVEDKLSAAGTEPHHKETRANDWMLLDYGDVVVHIFDRKAREFYDLDRMWADGETVDINVLLQSGTED